MSENWWVRSEEEIAYHEAGHAVVAFLLRVHYKLVSIKPQDNPPAAGRVTERVSYYEIAAELFPRGSPMYPMHRFLVENEIVVILAGPIAALKHEEQDDLDPYEIADAMLDDPEFLKAEERAGSYICEYEEEVGAYLGWLFERAVLTLDKSWPAVEALARVLLERKELDFDDSEKIIKVALPRQWKATISPPGFQWSSEFSSE